MTRKVIDGFVADWNRMDIDAIAAAFTPDAVWLNAPFPPVHGVDNIRAAALNFLNIADKVEFIVHFTAEASPTVILNERTDIFHLKSGRTIQLPVMGIFETSDGLIRSWRDYFDGTAYTSQLT